MGVGETAWGTLLMEEVDGLPGPETLVAVLGLPYWGDVLRAGLLEEESPLVLKTKVALGLLDLDLVLLLRVGVDLLVEGVWWAYLFLPPGSSSLRLINSKG